MTTAPSSTFWHAVGRNAPLMFMVPPVAWSINVLLARGLNDLLPPIGLAYWRWLLALLILLPFTWPSVRRSWPVLRREWRLILACAVFGIVGYHSLIYLALQSLPAANAALINSSNPLLIPVAAMLLGGDRVGRRVWLGLAVSLIGVVWVVTRGDPWAVASLGARVGWGELWILIAMINWAIYSVIVRWRPADLDNWTFLTVLMAVALVILTPAVALEMVWFDRTFPVTWTSMGVLVYLALGPSIAAYLAWNRSIQLIGPTATGLGVHVMTILIALGSVLILGEPIELYHVIGIPLVLGGVGIALARPRRASGPPPAAPPRKS
jgi:drug/metabolite transporter (DMT)-like permease